MILKEIGDFNRISKIRKRINYDRPTLNLKLNPIEKNITTRNKSQNNAGFQSQRSKVAAKTLRSINVRYNSPILNITAGENTNKALEINLVSGSNNSFDIKPIVPTKQLELKVQGVSPRNKFNLKNAMKSTKMAIKIDSVANNAKNYNKYIESL